MLSFLQEDADASIDAKQQLHPQPVVVVRGKKKSIKDAYIVTEGQVLCKVPIAQVPFALLSAFYIFNMQYPSGCTNFYSFLEFIFLDLTPPKRSRLQLLLQTLMSE